MVTEAKRAPRVVSEQTNFAAASAAILARLEERRRIARREKLQRIIRRAMEGIGFASRKGSHCKVSDK